jgi:uncharacterized protein YjdB
MKKTSILYSILLLFILVFVYPLKVNAVPITNAKTIAFDSLVEYEHRTNTEDWYKISLKAGEGVSFLLSARLNTGYLNYVIYDENDNVLTYADYIYNGGHEVRDFYAKKSGNYYIKVNGGGLGKYKLAAYRSWFNAGVEDKLRSFQSNYWTAKYIKPGKFVMNEYGQVYYRFVAKKGSNIAFNLKPYITTGRYELHLYDINGKYLTGNSYVYSGETATISYSVPHNQVYYLRVIGGSGEYDLSYTGLESDSDSDNDNLKDAAEYWQGLDPKNSDTDMDGLTDYNELLTGKDPNTKLEYPYSSLEKSTSMTSAFQLPVFDQNISVEHRTLGETWFKFNLKQNEAVRIFAQSMVNNNYLNFVLYDSNGNYISYIDYLYNQNNKTMYFKPSLTGTYYLKVYGGAQGKYRLGVHHTWDDTGITDNMRAYSSTLDTAKYISSGNKIMSNYGLDAYRFKAKEEVQFSINMKAYTTSGYYSISLYDEYGNYLTSQSYIYNGESKTISYTPALDGTYYITVSGPSGNYDLSFTGIESAGDIIPPAVSSVTPTNNSKNIPLNTTIAIKFSENIKSGTYFNNIALKDSNGNPVLSTVSITGNILTIKPKSNLAYSNSYNYIVPAGAVKDFVGNSLKTEFKGSFATVNKVVFKDKNLENAVRYSLNKTTGDITVTDMASLKQLWASNSQIAELSGLEYAINLEKLNLNNNQIKTISQLSNIKNLNQLHLSGNQIQDLTPLSTLTKLNTLDVSKNQVTDIQPLIINATNKGFINLGSIDMRNNKLDLSISSKTLSNINFLLGKEIYILYKDTTAILISDISLNNTSVLTGQTIKLAPYITPSNATNKTLQWSSSNTGVATVDSNGNVKGIAAGTASITARATDGSNKYKTITITVTNPILVNGITLSNASVVKGQTIKLVPSITPSNATNKTLQWSSSNTGVATVDSNGTVKGITAGTATITARATDGSNKYKTVTITVK